MREKSSSELTRRQQPQRVAMRDVEPLALVFRQASGLGERILQRAEHQRKGCAKLVADVGEKRRLGAVDFGQGFHSRPRSLEVVGSYNGSRNLPGQQIPQSRGSRRWPRGAD